MFFRVSAAILLTAAVAAGQPASRLINLSASGFAGSGANALSVGFTSTAGTKQMLLRGIGPALSSFGLSGFLAQPQLTLYSGQTVLATNSAWAAPLAALFAQVGAFALPAGSADAALVQTLAPASYTALVQGLNGTSGLALAEIYDADTGVPAGRLINLSARANVGAASTILTGGFVIAGTAPETVLLRGIGPSLSNFGISGALAQPTLTLFSASGTTPLATNAGWGGTAALTAVFTQVGAFTLPAASADAAMLVTLAPGNYSVQVAGSGIALVEIYEVPASALPAKKYHPGHYMMLNIDSTSAQQRTLIAQNASDPNLRGFQICYTWAQLETSKGNYSGIQSTLVSDLAFVAGYGKQLVAQIQYKSQNLSDFPPYLQAENNALVLGPTGGYYIPNLWDPTMDVQGRYLALLQQIATLCDANPNLELVNMAESAVVDANATLGGTYTPQAWVNALQTVAIVAGGAFVNTTFEEYINHISGNDALVGQACVNAVDAGCVFGGPDIDPSNNTIPSYNYYATYAPTSHLGSAVQPMDYAMTGQNWYSSNHSPTTENIFSFATSPRLHVDYIFWLNSFANTDWQNAHATIDAHPWPWY